MWFRICKALLSRQFSFERQQFEFRIELRLLVLGFER